MWVGVMQSALSLMPPLHTRLKVRYCHCPSSPLDCRAERAFEVMLPFLETQRHTLALKTYDLGCS